MTQGLARFHHRSPRYILSTDDDQLIRVSGPQQFSWEENTLIQNISLTGLTFTAHEDLCPTLGEIIKLQFTAPGDEQMACFGIVTRLNQAERGQVVVAVHFHKIEMAHRIALAQGLSRKIQDQFKKRRDEFNLKQRPWTQTAAGFVMFTSLWLWAFIIYALVTTGPIGILALFK